MKSFRYLLIVPIITIGLLSSCKDWVDTSINNDPNNPTDVSLNAVLPTAQMSYGYLIGGDINRYVSVFTQHHLGVSRQHQSYSNYVFTESETNNIWEFNAYGGTLANFNVIIEKAKSVKSPAYQGVGEVLMALGISQMSDLFGDVPYTDAFKGATNPTPKYDPQDQLYPKLLALLDSAVAHLNATSPLAPAGDDLIFGGDKSKWIKTAHTLKARLWIHWVKRDPSAHTKALAELAQGFGSNADDAEIYFGNSETSANPLYQFMTQRADIAIGEQIFKMLDTLKDPRIPMFLSPDGTGKYTIESEPGPYYASISSPVPFISYVEAKFIEAEAQFRAGDKTSAHKAFTDAIKASMSKLGVDNTATTAYLANPQVDPGVANITLQNIIEQKYIALYTQAESWSDWRRTGFPDIKPVTGTQIPRRFPYPLSERLYNSKNLPVVTDPLFSRIFWDS